MTQLDRIEAKLDQLIKLLQEKKPSPIQPFGAGGPGPDEPPPPKP